MTGEDAQAPLRAAVIGLGAIGGAIIGLSEQVER